MPTTPDVGNEQTPHDGVMTQRSGLGTTPAQNVISQLLTCEADGARQEDDSDDGLPPPSDASPCLR